MYKLLLIDDDRELLGITAKSLRSLGYDVRTATGSKEGLRLLQSETPDCVLLDVMMPEMDGFEACRRIRQTSNVPIIFLTGRVSEDDKVSGLLLGADDYIDKPYSLRELEARVQSAIRRAAPPPLGKLYFPPLEIDIAGHRALCAGVDLSLTGREYDLLYMFATSGGETVTYEDIGMKLWGSYRPEDRRSVMVSVSRLRKKLEVNPVTARMIETIWSLGYRFTGKKAGK